MPFIDVYTNAHIGNSEKKIKQRLGEAITVIPGKTEAVLMIRLSEDQKLYMAGDGEEPAAMVMLMVKGHYEKEYYEAFTKELAKILNEELGIADKRIYLKMDENDIWGVGSIIV